MHKGKGKKVRKKRVRSPRKRLTGSRDNKEKNPNKPKERKKSGRKKRTYRIEGKIRQGKYIKDSIIKRHNVFYSDSSSFSSMRIFDKVFRKGMDLMDNQMVLQAHGHIKSSKRPRTEITQSCKSCLCQGT